MDRKDAVLQLYDIRETRQVRLEATQKRKKAKTKKVRELENPLRKEKKQIQGKIESGNFTQDDIDRLVEINAYLNYYNNLKREKTVKEREVEKTLRKQIKEDTNRIRKLRRIDVNMADEAVCEALKRGEPELSTVVVMGESAESTIEGRTVN